MIADILTVFACALAALAATWVALWLLGGVLAWFAEDDHD
jgi:hypothetical protein